MARRKAPSIPDALLDQLLGGLDAASALNSPDWMNALKKALAEKALSAEIDYHLGAEGEAGDPQKPTNLMDDRLWWDGAEGTGGLAGCIWAI